MSRNNKKLTYAVCSWLLLVVFCMQFVVSFCVKNYWKGTPTQYDYILLTQVFSIVLPSLIVCLLYGKGIKKTFRIKKIKTSKALGCIGMGLCIQPVAILVNIPLQNVVSGRGGVVASPENIVQVMIMTVIVCLVPAFCEELLLRGMLLGSVKKKGYAFSIIVTTVMFVILHGDAGTVAGHAVLGIATAFAVLNTNSVLAGFFVHFSFNFCGLIIDYILNRLYVPGGFLGSFDFFLITGLVGVAFSTVLFKCVHSKKVKKYRSEDLFYNLWEAFATVPFAAMVIIYVLYAVM